MAPKTVVAGATSVWVPPSSEIFPQEGMSSPLSPLTTGVAPGVIAVG